MRYVKYVGLSHIRQITARDWRSVGLTGDTVVWSAQNGFAVPLDAFTEEQLQKAIDPDASFIITGEGEEDGKEFIPQPQTMDMTPAQLVQNTENPVDVVDMLEGGSVVSTDDTEAAPGGSAPTTTGTTGGAGHDEPGTTAH